MLIAQVSVNPRPDNHNLVNLATESSTWAIAGAIIIAAMPHLWQFLSGQQKARTDLTTSLLENLKQSYQQNATTTDELKDLLQAVAVKPTEIAQGNAQHLRDLLGEVAEIRGQIAGMNKKLDFISSSLTREMQYSIENGAIKR